MKHFKIKWMIGRRKAFDLAVVIILTMITPALAEEYNPPQPENPSQQDPKAGAKEIPLERLVGSPAAQAFQASNYPQALVEFQKLNQEYPEDTLIKRYIGMTLTLLGRLDEAAKVLEETVKTDPQNPANHYFLSRVYHEQGAQQKASKELAEVFRLDPQGYYSRAARDARPLVEEKAIVRKVWDAWVYGGYEYDSNVTLEPNDKALGSPKDQNSGRYYYSLGGTYDWLEKGRFVSIAGYRTYESFHDDGLNAFDFDFHEFSLDNRYRSEFFGKEAEYKLRYELPVGFLHGDLFSFSNIGIASVKAKLIKGTETEIFDKYSHIEFGPDGERPALTSRDGEYNSAGFVHRIYSSDRRGYVFGGYEFRIAAVRGDNYDSEGHFVQAGFRAPLDFIDKKLTWDVTGSVFLARYPRYSPVLDPTEPLARKDLNWTIYTRLIYQFDRHWALRLNYTYVDARNDNDLFQYDRHIGGADILYRF